MINLPYEILYQISFFMPVKDIASLKKTNKQEFSEPMDKCKEYFWGELGKRDYGKPFSKIENRKNEDKYKMFHKAHRAVINHGLTNCLGYNLSAILESFSNAAIVSLMGEGLSEKEENIIVCCAVNKK
jgi:hypothetical protein